MKHGIFIILIGLYTLIMTVNGADTTVIPGSYRMDIYMPLLKGKKVGIVANNASMVGSNNIVDTLISRGIAVQKIFCPEHGFRVNADAGEHLYDYVDPVTRIQVVSLYGNKNKPDSADISGIDVMVFDIQDVGVRFYTYLSTLHYIMEACAEYGVPLILFDRPNPNGFYIDGPMLDTAYASFVGLHPVPIVYGMTIAEYGMMINGEHWLHQGMQCELTVISCEHYDHSVHYNITQPPSPNLQNLHAVYLYPTLALFEGTIMNTGRGTDFPFEVVGHPAYPHNTFSYKPRSIKGVAETPKHLNKVCYGIDLRQYNVSEAPGIHVEWLMEAYKVMGGKESFFNTFFYNLSGSELLYQQIRNGVSEHDIKASWKNDILKFKGIRVKYLLYPDFE